jgi:O-antigen ligase
VWMNALAVMMDHPITLLTGFGWRVYETMFVLVTHNYYLDQWFGLGLVGLGCLLTILYQTVSTALRAVAAASPQARPFMLALVFGTLGLSICIFFENLDRPWAYVWVYIGFTLRAAADIVERAERHATQRAVAGIGHVRGPRPGLGADGAAPVRLGSAVGRSRR